ncbi:MULTISPECIES: hypothetical protein [unclassified Methanoculleus]|uniref:hypothetical protein n=1 Tax=unclassified Methanoculleus TaxID=2619537 RepID=UPI00316AC1BE|nr:hypothetical protein [Methanoculleus sp.]
MIQESRRRKVPGQESRLFQGETVEGRVEALCREGQSGHPEKGLIVVRVRVAA